jgi:hypothetical protein
MTRTIYLCVARDDERNANLSEREWLANEREQLLADWQDFADARDAETELQQARGQSRPNPPLGRWWYS